MSVSVHLFYFVRDWRKAAREILRVTRPGGPVVLMHTGMGEEVPFLNDRYKEACSRLGFDVPTIGVSSTRDVIEYLNSLGYLIETIRDRWCWTSRIRKQKGAGYLWKS